jgi:Porin subfamily
MRMHPIRLTVAALFGIAPLAGASTVSAQATAPATECPEAGPGFTRIGSLGACARLGLDVTGEVGHYFTDHDLHVVPARREDRLPLAYYESVRRELGREGLVGTLLVRPSVTMFTPTSYGPLSVHVRASSTSWADHLENPSTAPVFLDDAWASVGPLTVGRRFSLFDYNPGFTYKPGYTSYRTTNVLALTSPIGNGVDATLSLEDSSARERDDGVWATYGTPKLPDIVGSVQLNRNWGNARAAFAVHEMSRTGWPDCACTGDAEEFGFAGSAGVEYRQKFGDTYGRILLSGAAAQGAIDYLGVPHFAPDFVADANGSLRATRGVSALASYEHVWRPDLRTAVSFSWYGTNTAADDLRWQARGYLAQFTIEYMPAPNVLVGAEANHFNDTVKGEDALTAGAHARASTERLLFYVRRFF